MCCCLLSFWVSVEIDKKRGSMGFLICLDDLERVVNMEGGKHREFILEFGLVRVSRDRPGGTLQLVQRHYPDLLPVPKSILLLCLHIPSIEQGKLVLHLVYWLICCLGLVALHILAHSRVKSGLGEVQF